MPDKEKDINDLHPTAEEIEALEEIGNIVDFQKEVPEDKKNPVAVLRTDLHLLGAYLKYDVFKNAYLISRNKESFRPLSDKDIKELWGDIMKNGLKITQSAFFDLMEVIALENKIHPVKEYLESLQWDGLKRLDTWLQVYVGVDVSSPEIRKYIEAIGPIVFIAAVRRIYDPGCKFDELLLLEGDQGSYKSTLVKKMAKCEEWFTDSISLTADTKVIIENTRGKWIVELAEMKGLKKADNETIKNNLSRTADRARMSYGRVSDDYKRQFIFVGTINTKNRSDSYFTDQTGNRRYWPVKVGRIDLEAFERDLDQLWAEAVTREQAGERIYLDSGISDVARAQQQARLAVNPIENVLHDLFVEYTDDKDDNTTQVKDCCVLVDEVRTMLSLKLKRSIGDKEMGVAMTDLGYENKQARWMGRERKYVYRIDNKSPKYRIESDGIDQKSFKLVGLEGTAKAKLGADKEAGRDTDF